MTKGRPRKPATDRAILTAAVQLAAQRGYAGVSYDAVAAASGVSRPTIYRRWPTKSALLAAALHAVAPREQIPDTGDGLDDLLVMVTGLQLSLIDTGLLGVVLELMAATARPGAADEPLRRDYFSVRFATFDQICLRAIHRGQLPPQTSPALMRDLVLGPLAYRWLVEGALDDDGVRSLVEAAWRGMGGLVAADAESGSTGLPAVDAAEAAAMV